MSPVNSLTQKLSQNSFRRWRTAVSRYRQKHGLSPPDTRTDTEREAEARWRDDPVAFAVDVLGVTMWSRLAEVLRAVRNHKRVSVRSGHKVSKSTALAILALWWFWRGGQVLETGPTGTVVKEVWWAEVRRLANNSRITFPARALDPATGMTAEDGRRLYGYSTDAAERIAIRGPGWLFLIDEASGVHEDIFTALKGQAAGGARMLMVGNPTQPAGTFADSFTKTELYHTLHISSLESPNITGEAEIEGLATKEWVQECADDWGVDSPDYQIRVLGIPARTNANAVVPLFMVLAAVERLREAPSIFDLRQPLEFGVDVAGFGDDDSVSVARRGMRMLGLRAQNGLDEPEVAAMVLEHVDELRAPGERVRVKIDDCGVGAGVASILRQSEGAREGWLEIVGVNAADTDVIGDYPNVRSELWFTMRNWFRDGGAIVDDRKLQQEVSAPTYSIVDHKGRKVQVVEKKKDFKKRLKRSPDRADALALAVYTPASLGVQAQSGSPTTRWGEGAARSRGFG